MCSPSYGDVHMLMTSSLKPIASAHCMSHPWDFHPEANLHVCNLGPIVTATLTPKLASENALWSTGWQGGEMGLEMLGQLRHCFHHGRSSGVCHGGVCRMKTPC